MAKIKYHFNRETLSFDKIHVPFKEIFYKSILPHISVSFLLGILLFVFALYYIESPFEKDIKLTNNELTLRYELLNKRLDHANKVLNEIQMRDDNIYRMIFETQPIPSTIRKAGFGGSDKYVKLRGYENSSLMIETTKKIDVLSKQIVIQSKSFDEIIGLVKNKEKMLACIPAIQPLRIKDMTRFGSPFGIRLHPIINVVGMHEGVDLVAPTGTPIYASGDGIITTAGDRHNGFGIYVKITHGYSYATIYGHMSKVLVREGQAVKRGDLIGLVGSTGLSTNPHLHYEVRINNRPVDPLNFYYNDLSDEQYQKLIENAKTDTHVFEKQN